MKSIRETLVPLILFVGFFVAEVYLQPSELMLFILSLCLCGLIFALHINKREPLVFLTGLILGLIIEVGLGFVARQQHWDNASLFGVPLWLPIAWGMGFVIITRVGMQEEGIRRKK